MWQRELVLEEFLSTVDCQNLVVAAFDDEDGSVPVLLNMLFAGRKFGGAIFKSRSADLLKWAACAIRILDFADGAA